MNFCKGVLATALVASALAGCGTDLGKDNAGGQGEVGGIRARLSVPDGTTLTSVHYNITGPFATMGDVPVGDSTILTFRVGGLPVDAAVPYHIALTADTTGMPSSHCTGGADFAILDNKMPTLVNMVLACGESVDNDGDLIVNGTVTAACPVVTAITALPGEVTLTHSVSLTAELSSPTTTLWSGAGGNFGTASALATTYTCVTAGTHTLTIAVTGPGSCNDSYTVDIICTDVGGGPAAVCGNGGAPESGEDCDDGNTVTETCDYGEMSCTVCDSTCQSVAGVVTGYCGDSIPNGPEQCDDGPIGSATCTATCMTIVVGPAVCGNNIPETGEDCDDGNIVTETCDYGDTSCDVCDSTCQLVPGATAFCGDSIPNGTEECDAGPAGSATCSVTCTTIAADVCGDCREANCRDYQGVDFVAGCFESGTAADDVRTGFGATFIPMDIQNCVAAVNCAETEHCGKTPGQPGVECYCGPFHTTGTVFGLDECMATGPENTGTAMAPVYTAACKPEWEAAARSVDKTIVLQSITDLTTPVGWADFILECETSLCPTECP